MMSLYDCYLDGEFETEARPDEVLAICPSCGGLAPRIDRFRVERPDAKNHKHNPSNGYDPLRYDCLTCNKAVTVDPETMEWITWAEAHDKGLMTVQERQPDGTWQERPRPNDPEGV